MDEEALAALAVSYERSRIRGYLYRETTVPDPSLIETERFNSC
jgi:hypothetical protein